MGVPWCDGCAHEGKSAFCDPCGKCCMGNEFVKKEDVKSSVDFADRFSRMCDALHEWARMNQLLCYWYVTDEKGMALAPFCRRFTFVDCGHMSYKKEHVIIDFVKNKPEDDAKLIDDIKCLVDQKLRPDYKGGFNYLTTRNPYARGYRTTQMFVDDLHPKWSREADRELGKQLFEMHMKALYGTTNKEVNMNRVRIMDVIFNGPATIVIWSDKTKTVVKAQDGEKIDYEKGLAMAISKKFLGNKGNYYDTFEKYLKNAPVAKVDNQDDNKIDFEKDLAMAISKKFSAGKKKLSKKIEPTDEEIQANSDAVFAEFDEKVKKTRKTVKKDK